jgi:ribosomal protein L44E
VTKKPYAYQFVCEVCRQHTIRRQNLACYIIRYCTLCKQRTEHEPESETAR